MPTCNAYSVTLIPVTTSLLDRYWPGRPSVDVLCYENMPPERDRVTRLRMGEQQRMSWCQTLANYLQEHNADELVLLMLDDYGVCSPVKTDAIQAAERTMLADTRIANIHFTWQPINSKVSRQTLLRLPRWDYTVNTQAALWRRSVLLEILQIHASATIEEFELEGSRWFNRERFERYEHCQVMMPEPRNPSGFVDETEKTHWAIPYNNLMRRGRRDPRHVAFLASHGLDIPQK